MQKLKYIIVRKFFNIIVLLLVVFVLSSIVIDSIIEYQLNKTFLEKTIHYNENFVKEQKNLVDVITKQISSQVCDNQVDSSLYVNLKFFLSKFYFSGLYVFDSNDSLIIKACSNNEFETTKSELQYSKAKQFNFEKDNYYIVRATELQNVLIGNFKDKEYNRYHVFVTRTYNYRAIKYTRDNYLLNIEEIRLNDLDTLAGTYEYRLKAKNLDDQLVGVVCMSKSNQLSDVKPIIWYINAGVFFVMFFSFLFLGKNLKNKILDPIESISNIIDGQSELQEVKPDNLEFDKIFKLITKLYNKDKLIEQKDQKINSLEEEIRQNSDELFLLNDHLFKLSEEEKSHVSTITNYKQQIDKLFLQVQQKDFYFQAIVKNLSEGFVIIDQNNIIILCNNAFANFFDKKVEDFQDKFFIDCFEDESIKIESYIKNVIKTGSVNFEVISNVNGQKRYFNFLASLINTEQPNTRIQIAFIISDVTRKITSEKKITEQNIALRKYFTAIEQNPNSVVITNTLGEIEYVNPSFSFSTGYSLKEVIGKNSRFLKTGKTPSKLYKELWESISNGKVYQCEMLNQKKDGSEFWEKETISPIKDPNGEIVGYMAIKEDLTQSKKIEQELSQSQKNYSLIAQNSMDVIFIYNVESQAITFVSPSVYHMLNYQPEEIIRKNNLEVFSSRTANVIKKLSNKYQLNGAILDGSYNSLLNLSTEIYSKTGTKIYVEIHFSPIHKSQEDFVPQNILCVIHDFTKRKVAQIKLAESENNYRLIASHTADAIIRINPSTVLIEYASSRIESMTGYKVSEFIGQNIFSWLSLEQNSQKQEQLNTFLKAENSGDSSSKFFVQTAFKKADSSILPVELKFFYIFDNDKTIKSVVCIINDISEKFFYEQKLKDHNKLLNQILNNLPARIYLKDENFKYKIVNNAFASTQGYSSKELIGKDDFDLIDNQVAEKFHKLDLMVKDTKTPVIDYETKEFNVSTQKDEWHLTSKVPYFDNDNIFKGIIGIVMDITLRKQNEEEILERTRQFENTIKTLSDVYIKTDYEGNIIQVSPSICEFIGYDGTDLEHFIGRNVFKYPMHSEKQELAIDVLKEEKYLDGYQFSLVNYKGETIYGEANLTVWYDINNVPMGFEGIIRNITDRIIYEKTVEHQKNLIEIAHHSTLDSIKYAQTIQTSLLPSMDVLRTYLSDSFVIYRPKDVVGGDFYYLTQKFNKVIVAVGDCTGHGVPGALMSVLSISLINSILESNVMPSSKDILEYLRSQIIRLLNTQIKDGLDMTIAIIDNQQNIIEYSGANNHIYMVRDNNIEELPTVKCPVGEYVVHLDFDSHQIPLQKGDIFYMNSDGFQDQFGGLAQKKFGRRALKELFLEVSQKPMEDQKLIIENTFEEWLDNSLDKTQVDDVTILGFRI